jgi:creatinine amidohydrolase
MKQILLTLPLIIAVPFVAEGQSIERAAAKGILLEELTWVEAERVLTPEAVVVVPLGAEAKEHGPHLKLKNDWLMAEYLKKRVLRQADVVITPTINYSFYPAFLEYPGSTSLRLETARDMVIDICRSLARYGPRRFYVINTGVSTLAALKPAAEMLASEGITLRYSDILKITEPMEKAVAKQEGGTHADEVETSMMLYMAPDSVDMKKAVKDYHPRKGSGGFTRKPNSPGIYSVTGIWGDPTLATLGKGEKLTETLVEGVLRDIEDLRHRPVLDPQLKQ